MKITKKHHLVVERKKPLVYFIDKFVFYIFFCCKGNRIAKISKNFTKVIVPCSYQIGCALANVKRGSCQIVQSSDECLLFFASSQRQQLADSDQCDQICFCHKSLIPVLTIIQRDPVLTSFNE